MAEKEKKSSNKLWNLEKKSQRKKSSSISSADFLYFGFGARIQDTARIVDSQCLFLDDFATIDDFAFIMASGGVHIGKFSHVSLYAMVSGGGKFVLGDFSEISYSAKIVTGTDDIYGSFLFTPNVPIEMRNIARSSVEIGQLCAIGANTIIYPGVEIGDGVVVAPGTMVKTGLRPWHVYEGHDCKCIGVRKDRDKIIEMKKSVEASLISLIRKARISS